MDFFALLICSCTPSRLNSAFSIFLMFPHQCYMSQAGIYLFQYLVRLRIEYWDFCLLQSSIVCFYFVYYAWKYVCTNSSHSIIGISFLSISISCWFHSFSNIKTYIVSTIIIYILNIITMHFGHYWLSFLCMFFRCYNHIYYIIICHCSDFSACRKL